MWTKRSLFCKGRDNGLSIHRTRFVTAPMFRRRPRPLKDVAVIELEAAEADTAEGYAHSPKSRRKQGEVTGRRVDYLQDLGGGGSRRSASSRSWARSSVPATSSYAGGRPTAVIGQCAVRRRAHCGPRRNPSEAGSYLIGTRLYRASGVAGPCPARAAKVSVAS